jgi:hypothetical protein
MNDEFDIELIYHRKNLLFYIIKLNDEFDIGAIYGVIQKKI